MPLYLYRCPDGHSTEDLRKVDERHDPRPCGLCGKTATLEVQVAAFDPRMGLDAGFPTAYDRWAKSHARDAKGK